MPDKKTPIGKSGSKKPEKTSKKESKSELFLRLAQLRTQKVLKSLRILGNCSNRANYEYSTEQVESITEAIGSAFNEMITKFTPSKAEQESFKF